MRRMINLAKCLIFATFYKFHEALNLQSASDVVFLILTVFERIHSTFYCKYAANQLITLIVITNIHELLTTLSHFSRKTIFLVLHVESLAKSLFSFGTAEMFPLRIGKRVVHHKIKLLLLLSYADRSFLFSTYYSEIIAHISKRFIYIERCCASNL
ncbi:MAG: hypothetical protein IKQ80_06045, partial [Clostridia bacterium]|nr:hypothetical protein [Clostridia bacterium]